LENKNNNPHNIHTPSWIEEEKDEEDRGNTTNDSSITKVTY
jgi:hypothetical protein